MAKAKKIDVQDQKPKARSIQKVSFQAWFNSKVAQRVIRDYQVREITVFFKKQGLQDKEEMQIFDNKLNRFLGK